MYIVYFAPKERQKMRQKC